MLILALESSTQLGSVALLENGKILSELSSDNQKGHSEFMNAAIDECLKKANKKFADLGMIAVGIGPGSFTGIRVATNLARALAYSLKIPVFSADSLSILHFQTNQDGVFMINAFKNMVYFSAYQNGVPLTSPVSVPIDQLETKILDLGLKNGLKNPAYSVGDGYLFYEKRFSSSLKKLFLRNENFKDHPTAVALAKMAEKPMATTLDWKSLIPLYVRGSEAEEKRQHS